MKKKNCGCGNDPCDTYGKQDEAYNINASAGDMDMIHEIFDGLDDEQKTQIQRELTVKVRGISVPPVSPGLGKLKDRNPNDKDIADMPLSQLQKQFSDVLSDDISRLKKLAGLTEEAKPDMAKCLKVLKKKLKDEGGAAGFAPLKKVAKSECDIDLTPAMIKDMDGIKLHRDGDYILETQLDEGEGAEALTEAQFDEAAGEKDACYRKVKSRYKVWPSAYASGALVKCRKVGAANWGKSKK